MQSTKMTYNKNLINWIKLNLNTIANAIDDTGIKDKYIIKVHKCLLLYLPAKQPPSKTKNAGSSLANCDFVSKIKKNVII